jgi:hypothetical protein
LYGYYIEEGGGGVEGEGEEGGEEGGGKGVLSRVLIKDS